MADVSSSIDGWATTTRKKSGCSENAIRLEESYQSPVNGREEWYHTIICSSERMCERGAALLVER